MHRIRAVSDIGQLRAGLELLEAAAPGSMARNGRDFAHYWSFVRSGSESVWCAEDGDGMAGIFLGTPNPSRATYYDVVVAPRVDPYAIVADLVTAGAAAACRHGQVRLFSHDPLDGAEFYESLGHVPTMRVQLNGDDRRGHRGSLVRAMAGHRLLGLHEAAEWVAAEFRVDQVDLDLKSQLSDPDRLQLAMHMMHRWADVDRRPRYVVSGYRRFARASTAELGEIDPGLDQVARLHDDTTELRAGRPGHDLRPAVSAAPVTFAHSIVGAELEVELTGEPGDVERIVTAARHVPLDAAGSFAVECRKGRETVGGSHPLAAYTTRDVEIRVGTALAGQHGRVDLVAPNQIVAVYLEGGRALLGVHPPPFADQHRRRASRPTLVSRAEHKLAEALDLFDIALPAGGRAIDLGAAPGGWTYFLAERGMTVYAVDPGELHPMVGAHPRVRHVRCRAENLDLAATAGGDGDPGGSGESVDLVVDDMNLDPADSALALCAVGRWLRPGGYAIMTIKLPSNRPWPGIATAHTLLADAYDVVATRHLPHNRQEVTTVLRRRAVDSPA
ncbi:MAG TPA: SAM-dependent methyltransferase [Actinopolymorphaceae bacterium]|nr:SAM-dependent methyltransferase [Actinopolymorphaceae bacterium]